MSIRITIAEMKMLLSKIIPDEEMQAFKEFIEARQEAQHDA